MNLNKVALITGSTRGIGKVIAKKLALDGYSVVITGKSVDNDQGNIYSVAKEINEQGGSAISVELDLRQEDKIKETRKIVIDKYGKLDVLVNNASAMWWNTIENTPAKKFNLMSDINSRGTYLITREFIPHMPEGSHIITHSPPIDKISMDLYLKTNAFKHKVAYMSSKLGMSILASGFAQELKSNKIASNCIWPMTAIESAAMRDNQLISPKFNNPKLWRKAEIIGDMVSELVNEDHTFTNQFLIDELYLRQKGYTNFAKYQCEPGHEPPTLTELFKKMQE